MSHRYSSADEAARLNGMGAAAETPTAHPVTLTPSAAYEIDGAMTEAFGVLGRTANTKDFRLAAAIRAARVRLSTAIANLSDARRRSTHSASTPRVISRADAAAEPDGVPPNASGTSDARSGRGNDGSPERDDPSRAGKRSAIDRAS